MMRLPEGQVLRGIADLVLETEQGFVVVDHKLMKATSAEAVKKAQGFAGQLAAYRRVIEAATGKACVGCFVHLPAQERVMGISLHAVC